jgi:hypothetical protein
MATSHGEYRPAPHVKVAALGEAERSVGFFGASLA